MVRFWMQGYESKELAGAFMAFFRAIFGGEPNTELDIADSSFLLSCCVSAGFTAEEAEQFVFLSEDAAIKQRLKVFQSNPILQLYIVAFPRCFKL